jgi:hypothetical protein
VFASRPHSFTNQLTSEHFSPIGFKDLGPEVKARRQNIQRFLKQFGSGIQKIEDVTQTATDDLIQRLRDCDGTAVDVSGFVTHCIADVTVILLIGDTISSSEIQLIRSTLDQGFNAVSSGKDVPLNMFPWLRFFGNSTYTQLIKLLGVKNKIVGGWMDRKPEEGFIHHLQSMSQAELQNSFLQSYQSQTASVWEFLAAGVYTTSNTLTSLLNILCHYTAVQEKIRLEIMAVIGSRHPTLKDQHDMPYLRATLLEAGRFISLAAIPIPHKTLETCELGGFTIPANTQIWLNLWAMHHDEKHWDEPFEFRPERFLDDSGDLVLADHPNRRHLLPFSAGSRVCVGEVFALSRMFLITARILQNFSILPETSLEQQPSCDPRDMKMTLMTLPPQFKV